MRLLLALVLFAAQSTFAAAPVVLIPASTTSISVVNHASWLRDSEAKLGIDDIMGATGWQTMTSEMNFGFTKDVIWLRLRVERLDGDTSPWLLEVRNSILDDIRFYSNKQGGQMQEYRAGRNVQHSNWPMDTRVPTFRLDLPSGTQEILLRVQTKNSLSAAMHLWPADLYHAHARDEAMVFGLYFGFFLMVMVFHFFLWLTTRAPITAWYLPYILVMFLAALMVSGYPANLFNWPGSLASVINAITVSLGGAIASKLTSVMLDLPVVQPRMNRIYLRTFISLSVISTLMVLFGQVTIGLVMSQIVALVLIASSICLAVYLIRQGNTAAKVYLFAFAILEIGVVIRYFRNLGLLVPGPITDYSYFVGSLLHMIIISLVISYRYNAMHRALIIEKAARQEQREFVAMVSHEFRTPLAIINTSVQLLAANLDAPPEKTRTRCKNIRAATKRMSDLMDSYLSADRLESTHQLLQLQVGNPKHLFEEAITDFPEGRVLLTMQNLQEAYRYDPELMLLVLRNLLTNADRHSQGETALECHATGDSQGGMHITIADHGPGIPPDEIPYLFQKYFRGRAARGMPGAGLGLFLVKRVVELHGGQVSINSRSGRTSFNISLPAIALGKT